LKYIQNIKKILAQPFPQEIHFRSYFSQVSLSSLGVFFILATFQPFGLHELPTYHRVWVSLGFGVITFLLLLVNYLWILLFPTWFDERTWTLGKEILWAIYSFLIGAIGVFFGGNLMLPDVALFDHFENVIPVAVVVGILPYLLVVYISHNRCLKKYLKEAKELETNLSKAHIAVKATEDPIVPFSNDTELFPPIRRSQWLFLEAEGNYLRLWTRKENQLIDYRFRNTIKEMQKRLDGEPTCFQSHRAYLVNLNKVKHIEGNSAGFKVRIDSELPPVPVSRSRTKAFREALVHHELDHQ